MTERVQRVVRQLLQRVFGIAANALPGDPWPTNSTDDESTGTPALPGDPWPGPKA